MLESCRTPPSPRERGEGGPARGRTSITGRIRSSPPRACGRIRRSPTRLRTRAGSCSTPSPFQTYDPSSGREFIHRLTREAPVIFTLKDGTQIKTTVWAVGFYNPRAAYALGQVWKPSGVPVFTTSNMAFPDGAVIGKLLFTTATPDQIANLTDMPKWQANISDPSFCTCKAPGGGPCSFQQISEQCARTPGTVWLMQFDIAVRDSRSPTGWAFGTFVADGQQKASEKNPWNRISPLGLMWGNDSPPSGGLAISNPADPRTKGFTQEVVFWDVVDLWNAASNGGHLGCNSRLNGPADNARSSCLPCHMTASVPDENCKVPPFLDLGSSSALGPSAGPGQCVPSPSQASVDAVYFATSACGTSFQGGSVVRKPQSSHFAVATAEVEEALRRIIPWFAARETRAA